MTKSAAATPRRAGFDDLTQTTLAILLGATGLGNLAYYVLSRRLG